MTSEEIEKEVMKKYPITKKERRGCVAEQLNNRYLRNQYRKLLEQESKTGICSEARKTDEAV